MKIIIFVFILTTVVLSQAFEQKLYPSISFNWGFGSSIAVDSTFMAIASLGISKFGGPEGDGIFIFERENGEWIEKAHLLPGNWIDCLDIQNKALIAGDKWSGLDGRVLLFKKDSLDWSEECVFYSPDSTVLYQLFGASVSIQNKNILIGAPSISSDEFVYLYEKQEDGKWIKIKTFIPERNSQGKDIEFGNTVELYNNLILIAAPKDNIAGKTNQGAIYVYEKVDSNWQFLRIITEPGAKNFGQLIAIWGEYVFVAAYKELFLYHVQNKRWLLLDRKKVLHTINSIAVNNRYLFVGGKDSKYKYGAVYIYSWGIDNLNYKKLISEYESYSPVSNEYPSYGRTVVCTNEQLFVSEVFFTDGGLTTTKGAVYVYSLDIIVGVNKFYIKNEIPNIVHIRPNPFNSQVKIDISLSQKEAQNASFKIYNVLGKVVRTFNVGENSTKNVYHLTWNGTNNNGTYVPSGVYFLVVNTGAKQYSFKLLFIK